MRNKEYINTYETEKGRKEKESCKKIQILVFSAPPPGTEHPKQCLKEEVTARWLSRLALAPPQNPWHRRQNAPHAFHYVQYQPHARAPALAVPRPQHLGFLAFKLEWMTRIFLNGETGVSRERNDRLRERHPGRKLSVWVVPTRDGCVNRHH